MLIGMFHKRKNPNHVSRTYLYAAIAKNEEATFFYFTARSVNFETKTIMGKYYDKGTWKEKEFPFPDVIINAINYTTDKQNEVSTKLKEIIPFTSYPVGSKTSIYNRLSKSKQFIDNIIPYRKLSKSEIVLDFLNKYNKVIIKPVRGHHGDHVIFIEQVDKLYFVKKGFKQLTFTEKELLEYIDQIILNKEMVIQKFITCKIKTGEPYDFRIYIQKGKDGKWRKAIIIPRVGTFNRVITNISKGAQVIEIYSFLKNEFGNDGDYIKKMLEDFAIKFVEHFETLYLHEFDELGIDLGLDENRHLWLYEVNWRPGHIFIESIAAKNIINYAIYLAKRNKNKENI